MFFLFANLLLNFLFASFDGIIEAILFYENINSSKTYTGNLHPLFVCMRSCFWASTALVMFLINSYLFKYDTESNLFFVAVALVAEFMVFPFFHDGFYYWARNYLDKSTYPKGFFDYSTTSNAIINLTFYERLIVFLLGLAAYSSCFNI